MKNLKMDQVTAKQYSKQINNANAKVRPYTPAEKSYFDKMGHTGTSHPGIATSDPAKNYKVYHTYYQWVGFILFFQVFFCIFLRFLSLSFSGNLVLPSSSPLENYRRWKG